MAVAKTIPITQGQFSVSANAGTLQPGCVYIIDRQSARLALTAHKSVGLRDEVNWADIQDRPDLDRPVLWSDIHGKPALGSAAAAWLTNSTGDGTAGHVLRVGDHSIGTALMSVTHNDLNNLPPQCTAFMVHSPQNSPAGGGWLVVQQWASNSNDVLQLVSYVHSVDEHIYYRRKRTGHWLPWHRVVTDSAPMVLASKTFTGCKEAPYLTTPSTPGATTIDLSDPNKGLQYLRPGTANAMSINYSRTVNDTTDQGRVVLVYLRPQANVTIAAHEVVAWPDGRNRPSPVFPANKTSLIRFQHVHFQGDRALWYAKPEPGAWNA